ncbi:hypothetical protein BSY15_2460 [Acidovorax sp. RAC01]|nr:hypothetical protein BSY15_2460 [Acidovorax sp. RAC01]
MGRSAVHELVKSIFRETAARLRALGPDHEAAASHVEKASAHWMRRGDLGFIAKSESCLPPQKAEALLKGTIETYQEQDGRPLKEIFLHTHSGVSPEEYKGFLRAVPEGVKLISIRVRQDRGGQRLYRYDDHPDVGKRGQYPVQRGVFWQRTSRHGLLYTNGFKARIASYDGFEIPVPLSITIQFGEGDIVQVAKDILGLTKLNYNSCQLGEGRPITIKYSDRVGEIILANPGLPQTSWKHNFKYYA